MGSSKDLFFWRTPSMIPLGLFGCMCWNGGINAFSYNEFFIYILEKWFCLFGIFHNSLQILSLSFFGATVFVILFCSIIFSMYCSNDVLFPIICSIALYFRIVMNAIGCSITLFMLFFSWTRIGKVLLLFLLNVS